MSDMAGLEGIDGFLGLDCFRSVPVTFDLPRSRMIFGAPDGLETGGLGAGGLGAGGL
jgi:hypothetical protein